MVHLLERVWLFIALQHLFMQQATVAGNEGGLLVIYLNSSSNTPSISFPSRYSTLGVPSSSPINISGLAIVPLSYVPNDCRVKVGELGKEVAGKVAVITGAPGGCDLEEQGVPPLIKEKVVNAGGVGVIMPSLEEVCMFVLFPVYY